MKRCRTCGDNQPAGAFHKDASAPDGRRSVCRACRAEVGRWEKVEARYAMSREDFYELLDAQDGRCAVCRCPLPKGTAVVDHDHDTGVVRGLLCNADNLALGFLGDGRDIPRIEGLLRYARLHSNERVDKS